MKGLYFINFSFHFVNFSFHFVNFSLYIAFILITNIFNLSKFYNYDTSFNPYRIIKYH